MSLPDSYFYSSSFGSTYDIRPYILGPMIRELQDAKGPSAVGVAALFFALGRMCERELGDNEGRVRRDMLDEGGAEWGPEEQERVRKRLAGLGYL